MFVDKPEIQCVPVERKIYRISSRNLIVAVYDGRGGFIGVREKFDSKFLFTEYWNNNTELAGMPAHYGTVTPRVEIGVVPDDVVIEETLGAVDESTGRKVLFDKPKMYGGKGWYFEDDGEAGAVTPVSVNNTPLFECLERAAKVYFEAKPVEIWNPW